MSSRTTSTALAALLLATSALLFAPVAAAQSALPCPTAAAPGVLTPGIPLAGSDAITGSAVADDCYYTVAIVGDPLGKQLRVALTSTSNHDVFVKETVASATPYACSGATTTATSETCTVWWPLVASEYSIRVKRSSTTASDFSLTAHIENAPASGCSNGFAVTPIQAGQPLTGTLSDVVGARCTYVLTGANPLADLAHPADDIARFSTSSPTLGNYDINVRKGLPPTSSVRDCAGLLTGNVSDSCDLVLESADPVYIMVRRTSGGGAFSTSAAIAGSSCTLGSGYHVLPDGIDIASSTSFLPGSKCHFQLPSGAKDDLLSIRLAAPAQPGFLTAFGLQVAKDVPVGVGVADCTGSASYLSFSGIVVATPAQCDRLLEDGQAHQWYARVTRAAGGSAAAPAQFVINGDAQAIPTLLNGVPQAGHVEAGEVQYWKVVVPDDATALLIQTAGDPSAAACALGSTLNPTVATACLLLPFPMLIGCSVAASYGVSCAGLTGSLYDTCIAQTGNNETCAQVDGARAEACAQIEAIYPGACAAANPSALSVKTTELDLLVRHRLGLPSNAVNDCRSSTPGTTEQCLFAGSVKDAQDNVTGPAHARAWENLTDLRSALNENRSALDQAFANLTKAIKENRSANIEPAWAEVRAALFNLTGKDPGALPATPSQVSSLPGTPGLPSPALPKARVFPGAGKYFIAVRGPDAASSLFYKGGDYVIVAAHDDVKVPSTEQINEQVDQAQDAAVGALPALPPALAPLGELLALVAEVVDAVQELLPELPLGPDAPVPIVLPDAPAGTGGDDGSSDDDPVGAVRQKIEDLWPF